MLDDNNLNEEQSESGFNWFILRVLRDEEGCVSQIKEHIAMRKLHDKITDVKFFKEFVVVESEEFNPHSEFLPKRGFKSTPTSVWTRLPNGNYKRLRLVARKPFSGMVFIRMDFDPDLFKMIRSWDSGYSFLGGPIPSPVSDFQLKSTESSLNNEIPDLVAYAKEKCYQIVEGSRVKLRSMEKAFEEEEAKNEEEPLDYDNEINKEFNPEEEREAQKAKIYSELNIKDYGNVESSKTFVSPVTPKAKPKKSKNELQVNDFVFIKHLGFKGIIQEIDYSSDKVVVGVQMFGRKQPVECKMSEVTVIYN